MNSLVIVLIGIVALGAGYLTYGRWLAKKWGIDPKAKTPAYTHEDGQDYVTLMTCTPYGINTHRLLVRGHRIENLPEEEVKSIPVVHVERELTTQEKIQKYIPFAVMGVAVLFLIALLMPSMKKDEHRSKESGEADDENKTN